MVYFLKQRTRNNQPIIIPLKEAEVVVGRNNAQPQRFPQLSEQHAKFYQIDDRIGIRDLGSRYGTYVNNARIGSAIKILTVDDIIGFGVNAKSIENGFVCILTHEPDVIDLSDDDDMPQILLDSVKTVSSSCFDTNASDVQENDSKCNNRNVEKLIEVVDDEVKNDHVVPSTSKQNTFVEEKYPRAETCTVPLIRCDSKNFLWPPGVKNPFLFESDEDENILSARKKRPKRISSDSSVENFEEYSSRSRVKKTSNKQNEFHKNISKSSSRKHSNDLKNLIRRQKRARRIISDWSDDSPVEPINSVHYKGKKISPEQSKSEDSSSNGNVALSEFPSDIYATKLNKNVYLNENNSLNVYKNQRVPASNLMENSNRDFHLNPLNDSNSETGSSSSYESCQINIQGKKLHLNPSNVSTHIKTVKSLETMQFQQEKDSCLEALNEVDSYSVAEEVIDISDGDDYFNIDMDQNFLPIKTEPEDVDDPEYYDIINEIFEVNDKSKDLPLDTMSRNSRFENKEAESIEKIQQFVNCFPQTNSEESEYGGSKELNSDLSNSESETSLEENFLPSVKSWLLKKTKSGVKKTSKSSGKTLLTDPKPMTYRPRKMRGRDEGYVERKKPLDVSPKGKRGRPRKENQLQRETVNFNSSVTVTKIPNKPAEGTSSLKNLNLKPSHKSKNTSEKHDFRVKNVKSTETSLPNSKQSCSSKYKEQNEDNPKRQTCLDPVAERKKGRSRKCSELENETVNPDLQKQQPEKPQNCNKENYVDCDKNKESTSSTGTKHSRKNITSSVKVRPDKFCSRMGFLTNKEETKPARRDKFSGKTKKYKSASNANKNKSPQNQFENKNRSDGLVQNEAVERNVVSENGLPINNIVDKYPERESFPNTLQNKNLEESNIQPVPHFSTDELNELILHIKNLGCSKLHSSADASSSHTLPVENLEDGIFQNAHQSSNDTLNRISLPREASHLPFELSFIGMVKSLLKLKSLWLQEQRRNSDPPPDVLQGVQIVPLCFASYDSYAASFYSLLKLEIWQYMFEAAKEVLVKPYNNVVKRFNFRVLSSVNQTGCIELKCEAIVNDKFHFEPREGMMTVLDMNVSSHQVYPLFGFIFKHKVSSLKLDYLHPCWKKNSDEYLKGAKHWIFHAWIKEKQLLLESGIVMSGNGICYLRNKLWLADTLSCLKYSPLVTDIIEPRLQTFSLTCSKSSSNSEYTSRQLEIIQAICSEIYKPYYDCKITLIHGPPGTGKTHIIIGILETLFYTKKCNPNVKVLVTAPSNVAVDEIGCRLIDLNERWGDNAVKFVRIGVEKQIHPKMLPYFIDRKAAIAANLSLKNVHYLTEIKYKCDVLKESHIVLTTLSGCNLSLLKKTVSPDSNFSCCIVDESTQSTELEILQPLALGISRVVLVGDEKSLPPAHSEYTKTYRFHRSMFERFCQYFKSTNQPSPVLSLTEQFRMHPSIFKFPSTYMYNLKLDVHPEAIAMSREFPLLPYILLDTAKFSETVDCDILIEKICKFLAKVVDSSSSVGVIVPHESQRSLCTRFLHSHWCSKLEVNTVNGFQGREKDIIILYAIDPKFPATTDSFITCKQKFNVALTRARKCLIICLDSRILLQYQHWKSLINDAIERNICIYSITPRNVHSVFRYAKK